MKMSPNSYGPFRLQVVSTVESEDATRETSVFDGFRRGVESKPLCSWRIADIRTVNSGSRWIASMVVRTGDATEGGVPFTLDESWVRTGSGFCVLGNQHQRRTSP
jgi:hypothetical protein